MPLLLGYAGKNNSQVSWAAKKVVPGIEPGLLEVEESFRIQGDNRYTIQPEDENNGFLELAMMKSDAKNPPNFARNGPIMTWSYSVVFSESEHQFIV